MGVNKLGIWADKEIKTGVVLPQRPSDSHSDIHTQKQHSRTLTMSMIRCPQALHLSADCWKPEYCNRPERLGFHLTTSNNGLARAFNLAMLITSSQHRGRFWLANKTNSQQKLIGSRSPESLLHRKPSHPHSKTPFLSAVDLQRVIY